MEEKKVRVLSRPWIHALRAAVSTVLGLGYLAGSCRREKKGLSVLIGLLWLAGGVGWMLCLLLEIGKGKSTKS